MPAASLVLLWVSLLTTAQDRAELVRQLGSPRYAEREAAGSTLRALGREALDVLRPARESRDPEVRNRASDLVAEIEAGLLVEPTLVRLRYRQQTIAEIVRDLESQSETSINFLPETAPEWTTRRLTLERPEPVPLWTALDELCRAGGLFLSPVGPIMMGPPATVPRAPAVAALTPIAAPLPPDEVSGPFRVSVHNIEYHKGRLFQPAGPLGTVPAPVAPNGGGRPGQPAGLPTAGVTTESFQITLQLQAEPRISVAQEGPARLLEAVDDLGQSLVPAQAAQAVPNAGGFQNLSGGGSTPLQVPLPLSMPRRPGTTIKRLKGKIPVAVIARKPGPLVIPLTEKDKLFENGSIAIKIHGVKQEQAQGFTLIDLTVKSKVEAEPNRVGFGPEFMIFRHNPGNPQSQVELVDDQNRPLQQWFAIQPQPGNDGMRMTVRVMPSPNVGPPAAIRHYELSRTSTDVDFELRDIPMP